MSYYIGLDIGSDSVGWAVTDGEYQVKRCKGNAMWGIRLLDESNTAAERRGFRAQRRRIQRTKERIDYLEMLFNEEISKKDIAFFRRLRDSNLYLEDKSESAPGCVFNDSDYTDVNYHKEYPTIYHLRKELIEKPSCHDVRLVYIALHHIIKHRGHFLFDSLTVDDIQSFSNVFDNLCMYLKDNYNIIIEYEDIQLLETTLKNREFSKTKKAKKICALCRVAKSDSQKAAILKSLSGATVKFCDVFDDDMLKEAEITTFSFDGNFDDKEVDYQNLLGERFELLEKLKAVYDWSVLANILKGGEKYISCAKVNTYETHKFDLRELKTFVKTNCPEKYSEVFRISKGNLNNYVAYSGCIKSKGGTGVLKHKCNQADFCDYLKKTLKDYKNDDYAELFNKIENGTFMPKQISKDNGVIPMQLHRVELVAILDNAKKYLDFLNHEDENGLSVSDKIISVFDYRIPYYVGPLNLHSKRAWLSRTDAKIYPWNFNDVVDTDKSSENFIANLTSKCTYLPAKDVIPKNSLLYSRYMVLNEINNLRVNGEKISVGLKQEIYNELFLKHKKVTNKMLSNFLTAKGYRDFVITGIDGDFKSTLKPCIELRDYRLSEEDKEYIILSSTIFGDERQLLRKRLTRYFSDKLTVDEINKISKLKYSGWGAFSKEFLTEVNGTNKRTGEMANIINALWNTNDNLMTLLGSEYTFAEELQNALTSDGEKSMREVVEDLYVSPKVKRPVYQALKITKEIVKTQNGKTPDKIFIEMARGPEEKKRTVSRKNRLVELYKACKKDSEELFKQLENTNEAEFKRDALYLYYTQFGKCMYTGEPILLENIYNRNIYDIDHIFPRSKVKDDSLDNRVLVKKEVNEAKDNNYPLSEDVRKSMYPHWKFLLDKNLISQKKFERLMRNYPLSDSELADFIQRQIVETRQSTKAVGAILSRMYPDTEIVYVKAALVSEFRQTYDMLKCREVNDLHHAKDAYLNIVVGNVYNERCTHNKANFIKGIQTKKYSLNHMFDFNVNNAWVSDNDQSIGIVKRMMSKNNILCTRYSFEKKGGLFDQLPLKKGVGQVSLKQNSPRSDVQKYGGYAKPSSTYFAYVEYVAKKGKTIKALVPIDLYTAKGYEENPEKYLSEYVGLSQPRVIIPKIKYGVCLSFDGFRATLSGKTGNQLVYKSGVQLVLGYSAEKYIKEVAKFVDSRTSEISVLSGITKEKNLELYDLLLQKLTTTVFRVVFSGLAAKLTNKRDTFILLSAEQQCVVINEIIKDLHANATVGDLSLIGEKNSRIVFTNNISQIRNIKSVKLINQSVTGLYESEIDLI